MPESVTYEERLQRAQAQVEERSIELVRAINECAVREHNLKALRSDRTALPIQVSDAARAFRASEATVTKTVQQLKMAFCVVFDVMDEQRLKEEGK